jgi:Zn-dependent alcohol dehydrogenase
MQAGRLDLAGLVTHEFKLEQINEALAVVRSGEAGRRHSCGWNLADYA